MSNKQQLQTNNTKYASLIETLRGKAAGTSGEDVTEETNAYTTKIATLETAVAALETELEGKASGGSGDGSIDTCTVTVTCQQGYIASFVTTIKNSDNGVPYYYSSIVPSETSLTVENVVCGSPIVLQIAKLSLIGNNVGGGAEFITVLHTANNRLFKAPTEAGAVGTISIYSDD